MKMPGTRIAATVVFVCGAVSSLWAQQNKPPKPPPAPNVHANGKPAGGAKGTSPGNPAKELERFSKMSPQDREKALSKLPPQRRAAFEQRLARYESLTPEQQQRVNHRVE